MHMKMKIRELHEQFCQEALVIRNLSPATIKWYRGSMNAFLKHREGRMIEFLEDVTTDRLRSYLYAKRIEDKWKSSSFINQRKGIRSFFTWCVKRKYIKENPVDDIEKPKIEKSLPKRITLQEAQRVLEYSFHMRYNYRHESYRNRAVFAVMIYAGLRSKEVLNLKVADIDLENGVLTVKHGKGAKDRIIPISPMLHKYLSEYIKDKERLNKECEWFFLSLRGDTCFTYSGLKRIVERVKQRTKIYFSPHRLRHTFATLMLEAGVDLFSLSKMMGHSDIKTTTIYLSASVKHLKKEMMKHPLG